MTRPTGIRPEGRRRNVEPVAVDSDPLHGEGVGERVEIGHALTRAVGEEVHPLKPGRVGVGTQVKGPGRRGPGLAAAGRDAVGEAGDLGEGGEGEAAEVHPENTLGVAGVSGAAKDQRRGSLGSGEGEFLPDEIALGVGAVGVEVRVVAEAVLVAGGGEGIIGNPGFAQRVVAGKNGEGRGEGGVEGGGRSLGDSLAVTLDPRQLAAGVQHHLLGLRRSSNGQRDDQSHGILEGRFVVVGGSGSGYWILLGLPDERRGEDGVVGERRQGARSKREGDRMVESGGRGERSEEEEEEEEEEYRAGGSHDQS